MMYISVLTSTRRKIERLVGVEDGWDGLCCLGSDNALRLFCFSAVVMLVFVLDLVGRGCFCQMMVSTLVALWSSDSDGGNTIWSFEG